MASESPEPDTYEWTLRGVATHIQQADIALSNAHSIHHERSLTPEVQARATLAIAHSLHAMATMLHYAFGKEFGDG